MSLTLLPSMTVRPSTARERRKINVAYLLGSLRKAGTEGQVLELLKGLDRECFCISIILLQGDGAEKIPWDVPLTVLNVPGESAEWARGLVEWPKAMGKLYARLAADTPDVVHAFLSGPSILGSMPSRMARVPIFIGSRRSLVADYRRGRFAASLADTFAFKSAHFNLGNCLAVTTEMVSNGGCSPGKSHTIYNGVDSHRFHPGISAAWRREVGWDDSHIVFGVVANFYAYKRHIDFVQAASLILQRHQRARFVMVGTDYGTRDAILREISARDLSAHLRVLPSHMSPEQIFAGLDVLVCPSESEGFSNVLLEAMACAKPVIATNVGGNPELVQEGDSGFLVSARSPQAIAEAAEKLISDPRRRLDMGWRGRQRVERHFGIERMVKAHEDLYRRLLTERKRLPA